jgi:hypothetical protein
MKLDIRTSYCLNRRQMFCHSVELYFSLYYIEETFV